MELEYIHILSIEAKINYSYFNPDQRGICVSCRSFAASKVLIYPTELLPTDIISQEVNCWNEWIYTLSPENTNWLMAGLLRPTDIPKD